MITDRIKHRIYNAYKRNTPVVFAFATVFLMLLVVYIVVGIYPFGDKIVLKIDLWHAYAPLRNQIKEFLLSGADVSYSWNIALGTPTFGTFLSEILNPFFLLVMLFPLTYITEAYAIMLILQIPLCAATCAYFIHNKYRDINANKAFTVMFSVMYALSAFMTAYYWNIMWLNGVIMLPLVALGLERLVKENKSTLYCVALAYTIATNFLMGFFLCGFSLAYFIILLVTSEKRTDKAAIRSRIFSFTTRSLLAGGMSAFVTIVAFSIIGANGVYTGETAPDKIYFYFSLGRFWVNSYFGMKPGILVANSTVPNVYAGVLSIILLPLFYFNKNIKIKEKVVYSIALLILYLGFSVNILDYIFHGLHFNAMIPHRYSYIYSFMLLLIGYKTLINFNAIKNKAFYFLSLLMIAVTVVLYFLYPQVGDIAKPGKISLEVMLTNVVIIVIYCTLLVLYKKWKDKRTGVIISYIFVFLVVAELTVSTHQNFLIEGGQKRSDYVLKYLEGMNEATELIEDEDAFYRTEYKHHQTLNDGALYGYNGISAFGPVHASVVTFSRSFGLPASGNNITFSNPTPFMSSIFAVKYQLHRENRLVPSLSQFEYKTKTGNIVIYENPYVLPLGFMVKDTIEEWNRKGSPNPYELQDQFARATTGTDLDMFSEPMSIESVSTELIQMRSVDEFNLDYEIYEDVVPEDVPTVNISYVAKEDKPMYISLAAASAAWADVLVDGKPVLGQTISKSGIASLDAGYVEAGQTVEIKLKMTQKPIDEDEVFIRFGRLTIYTTQMDVPSYEECMDLLNQQPLNVTYYDNTTIKGTVHASEDGILFTSIPYNTDWKIKVDGKEKTVKKLADAFIGIRLDEGEHEIELEYKQSGVVKGAIISLISVAIFVALTVHLRKREQVKKDED